jgi:Elongation factor Tu C-terminal domain
MTADEFVKAFYQERQSLIDTYFNADSKSDVSELIQSLNLDDKGTERLRQILNGALRDTFYTILLGLDGEASIGDKQIMYKLFDEENNELTGGEIEAFAYEYFHNNKLQVDKGEADFIATLTYLTTEQGGRQTPVFSSYRPQVKFEFAEMQTSGQQTFIDREIVYPGDTVEAEIKIISVDYFAGQLTDKMKFDFREGSKIIGTGQIKHILNDKLRQASR